MTPKAQRIAIAEFCGRFPYDDRPDYGFTGDGKACQIPDYLNDLNAMHEAEKLLPLHDADVNVPIAQANWSVKCGNWLVKITNLSNPYYADAAQHAEAFLRTIEKWH